MTTEIAMIVETPLNNPDLKAAIIGVVGTLMGTILGTVLGWILGKIDMGRLWIAFDSTSYEFTHIEDSNQLSGNKSNAKHSYLFHTTIQLYNSSNINQVIRNVQIAFTDGKHDLLVLDAKDDRSQKLIAQSRRYENLSIVNISPHTGIDVKIHINTDGIDQIYEAKKILLQYKNQRLKTKRVLIKTVDYSIRKPVNKEVENNA